MRHHLTCSHILLVVLQGSQQREEMALMVSLLPKNTHTSPLTISSTSPFQAPWSSIIPLRAPLVKDLCPIMMGPHMKGLFPLVKDLFLIRIDPLMMAPLVKDLFLVRTDPLTMASLVKDLFLVRTDPLTMAPLMKDLYLIRTDLMKDLCPIMIFPLVRDPFYIVMPSLVKDLCLLMMALLERDLHPTMMALLKIGPLEMALLKTCLCLSSRQYKNQGWKISGVRKTSRKTGIHENSTAILEKMGVVFHNVGPQDSSSNSLSKKRKTGPLLLVATTVHLMKTDPPKTFLLRVAPHRISTLRIGRHKKFLLRVNNRKKFLLAVDLHKIFPPNLTLHKDLLFLPHAANHPVSHPVLPTMFKGCLHIPQ